LPGCLSLCFQRRMELFGFVFPIFLPLSYT
jgi:hypothetical protein